MVSCCILNKKSTSSMSYKVTVHLVGSYLTLYLNSSLPLFLTLCAPSPLRYLLPKFVCSLFSLPKILLLWHSLDAISKSSFSYKVTDYIFRDVLSTLPPVTHFYVLALCLYYFLPSISMTSCYLFMKIMYNCSQKHQLDIIITCWVTRPWVAPQ